MKRKIDTVLFDFEGTLVDFQWRLKEAVDEVIVTLEKEGCPSNLFGINPSYTHIFNKSVELVPCSKDIQSSKILNIVSSIFDFYDSDALTRWQLHPHTMEVLNELKEDSFKLGLVTNIGERAILKAMDKFKLSKIFDVIITRNDVTRLKPDPEGLNSAIEKLNANTEKIVFVGDSYNDIEAARKAGIFSCYLVGGENSQTKNSKFEADYEITSIKHLLIYCSLVNS